LIIIGFTPLAFSALTAAHRRNGAAASLPLHYEAERAETLDPPIPVGKRISRVFSLFGGPTGTIKKNTLPLSIGKKLVDLRI